VTRDYDQAPRPTGALPDVGADELDAVSGPPEAPSGLQVW
jgi:hypothetical protein